MNFDLFQNQFNNIDLSSYFLLKINDRYVGYIKSNIKNFILEYFSDFFMENNNEIISKYSNISFDASTKLFQNISNTLLNHKIIPYLRNEYILVTDFTLSNKIMKVDRSIGHLFGFIGCGIHVNVFVKKEKEYFLWVSKRGNTKVEPFKLDSSFAGAISYGYSAMDTVIKEGKEEASLDQNITSQATYSASLAYMIEKYGGLRNDIMHIFNLEVDEKVILKPYDNEAEDFYLWNCNDLQKHLIFNLEDYKYNSALSIFKFLLEKQIINKSMLIYDKIFELISKLTHKENNYFIL